LEESASSSSDNAVFYEEYIESYVPTCPNCPNSTVVTDYKEGVYICTECAMHIGNRIISDGTEWRSFEQDGGTNKADPNRVGGRENELLEDLGLSTVISGNDALSRTQNRGTMSASARALLDAFKRISKLASKLSLGEGIVRRAEALYQKAEESKEFRKVEPTVVACLFVACRQAGVPRTIREFCASCDVKRKDVGRCLTKLKNMKIYKRDVKEMTSMPNSAKFMERFCSLLKLPPSVVQAAAHIASRINQTGIGEGKTPATLAGAAIYLATQLAEDSARTYQEIGTVTHMAGGTIRQAYMDVFASRHALVPDDYASKERIDALPPP